MPQGGRCQPPTSPASAPPRTEQNCKREAELLQLWWEPEAAALQSAAAASRMHRKHTDSVAELTGHVENLQRVMSKLEKDKQGMKAEINATVETTQKSTVSGIPEEPFK